MAAETFNVIFARRALGDLLEIVEYWGNRYEPERGEKYSRDLSAEAIRQLADANTARGGRYLRRPKFPKTQELAVFKRSYRILYSVNEKAGLVEILRFWHSSRDEPFRE
jgi:plasmid stabilization system protein ParE